MPDATVHPHGDRWAVAPADGGAEPQGQAPLDGTTMPDHRRTGQGGL